MARFGAWSDIHGYESNPIYNGLSAFCSFYETSGDEIGIWETNYVRDARRRGVEPFEDFTCLLDYVYVWLVEGPAVMVCPTYERYLLAVIGIVEQLRVDQWEWGHGLRLSTATEDGFHVFNWGPNPREVVCGEAGHYDQEYVGLLSRQYGSPDPLVRVGARTQGEGFDHPALRRDLYEHYREEYLAALRNRAID